MTLCSYISSPEHLLEGLCRITLCRMLPSRILYPNSFALLPHSDSSKMLLTRQTVCLLQAQKDSPVFPDSWHSSCRLLQQSFGKPKTRDLSSLHPARDDHDTRRMLECAPVELGAGPSRTDPSHRINKLVPFVSHALTDRPISPICQGGFTNSTAQSGLSPVNHPLNIFLFFSQVLLQANILQSLFF